MKFDQNKQLAIASLAEAFAATESIESAIIYGSWLHDPLSRDVDIAIMVKNQRGVIAPEIYRELWALRLKLSNKLNQDVDLVPHTQDELDNYNTPIWYPKTNPALCSGYPLKGEILLRPFSLLHCFFRTDDIATYFLHDNRTICRRQILRHLDGESGRIFVSKMLHGPANALTLVACRRHQRFISSTADLKENFGMFDIVFEVDSSPARPFLFDCKRSFSFERAILLLNWYEHLQAMVLTGNEAISRYQNYCLELEDQTLTTFPPESLFNSAIPELAPALV
jgi:predicted nucleotidyltransferase